jgi:hypothetical protein
MFEATETTVIQAVRSVLKEYGLDWSLEDIVENGADRYVLRFHKGSDGRAALALDMQDVVNREGSVTEKGVAEELRKSLQQLGITPPQNNPREN